MGFVSVTCANCAGQGLITVEQYGGCIVTFKKVTCNECEGVGSHMVHAGRIGSYNLSVDPSGSSDEGWACVWKRHDDNVVEVVEMFQLPDFDREVVSTTVQSTVFGRNSRWSQ